MNRLDSTDRRIILALDSAPRATVQYLSDALGLARGTVQARLERLISEQTLRATSTTVTGDLLDLPLRALVTAEVDQAQLRSMLLDLSQIPEIIECMAISGENDLMLQVLARDADHVYEITQRIMACRGIRRTATSIVLREIMSYRIAQLLAS